MMPPPFRGDSLARGWNIAQHAKEKYNPQERLHLAQHNLVQFVLENVRETAEEVTFF